MQRRTLGSQGLAVSEVGYGSMGINMFYGSSDHDEGVRAIQRAHDLGVTLFDTAELYGWGENEKLVGRAIKDFRDEVVVATKFGFTRDFGRDSRPDHVREVVENSLHNLDVDVIDVVYQHRLDPSVPIEDVAGTLKELIDEGKVKHYGLCEVGPRTIERAHAVHPVSVVQTEYSLFAREVETIFPTLDELGIGFVPYSPLARGFLVGSPRPAAEHEEDDARRNLPWWQPENFEHNRAIVERLATIAQEKDATVPQLALAWLLTRGEHVVPIPGSRSPQRVEQNVAAATLDLTADDLAAIDAALGDGPQGASTAEAASWE
ncbi:aldo/keto reductase [Aeromicrobium sp. IC_218]|uniref:aldo/keto reductase n=1 Tax=Aeromicrobium sp. IC_218 TaxID=2545468 RepID=UPI00103CC31E|nr:aldo/keto reductase [Aeromicrobium sp. IC_218]TCI98735.1 aldo/keto reductase [Aeromicrobium sp. IC_218]